MPSPKPASLPGGSAARDYALAIGRRADDFHERRAGLPRTWHVTRAQLLKALGDQYALILTPDEREALCDGILRALGEAAPPGVIRESPGDRDDQGCAPGAAAGHAGAGAG
jgi:hypothetical protein